MPDSSNENRSGRTDDYTPTAPTPHRGSLRRRYLFATVFFSLVIMIMAVLAEVYLENTRSENSNRILQRLQVSGTLNATLLLLGDLNDAVNNYLLAPQKKTALEWESSYRQISTLVDEIGKTDWIRIQKLRPDIDRTLSLLKQYRQQVRELFVLRRNAIRQNPAFYYARETMLPRTRSFNAAINHAIAETGEDLGNKRVQRIYDELNLISRLWQLMVAEFRMYFINRMGSFSLNSIDAQARSITGINRDIIHRIDVLLKRPQNLDFETLDALQKMKKDAIAWEKDLEKIFIINRSRRWRMDLVVKENKVIPIFNQVHARLLRIEQLLRDTANQDIDNMAAMANNTIKTLWVLSGLTFLLFFAAFVYLDRTIFRSVRDMSRTLRQASAGGADTPLPQTNMEETYDMVAAFTEMRRQVRSRQSALEHQAMHDALTGLPNRSLLQDRLQQAIFSAKRKQGSLTLMIMDLDHFKEINDTLGHQIGDQILERVGLRLLTSLRETDTIARLGGDEFAILLPSTGHAEAIQIVEKIHNNLEKNFNIEGHTLYVGASIGITLFPEHGTSGDLLMQRADVAMYNAKRNNDRFAVYDTSQDSHSPGKLTLISDLRTALKNGDVQLHYQPQMHLASQEITGVEALLRWSRPRYGRVPPDQVIPLAENTGLIRQLTLYVLEMAIRQCCQWHNSGHDINVSVNLSTLNLQDKDISTEIERLVAHYSLPYEALTLEITETAFMSDIERAVITLNSLHEKGIRISVDDYGTGFSSLAYLKRLPVHELKIDRSFVMNMETDDNDAVIVRSTIDLAHNLSLNVVAEGVEDKETMITLHALGCDSIQGYHLGKPMPAEDFEKWLNRRQSA